MPYYNDASTESLSCCLQALQLPGEAGQEAHPPGDPSHPHFRTRCCPAFMSGRPCTAEEGGCFWAHGFSQLRCEEAVQLGVLDPAFRTVLCHVWLAEGSCPVQERCTFAHGLEERRVEAAITLGALPRHFKTRVCHAFSAARDGAGGCPLGQRCYFAHGSGELRVEAAIELGVLPPSFKTRICSAWANTGACPVAERCLFAHGVRELRVDAAIALGLLPSFFKTRLCTAWGAAGAGCVKGQKCFYAHGPLDLRCSAGHAQADCTRTPEALSQPSRSPLAPAARLATEEVDAQQLRSPNSLNARLLAAFDGRPQQQLRASLDGGAAPSATTRAADYRQPMGESRTLERGLNLPSAEDLDCFMCGADKSSEADRSSLDSASSSELHAEAQPFRPVPGWTRLQLPPFQEEAHSKPLFVESWSRHAPKTPASSPPSRAC